MSIADFFGNMFSRKKVNNKEPQNTFLERMNHSMALLLNKSQTLNSSWQKEKDCLQEIMQTISTFVLSNEIASAKMEQDILSKITAVSSACDRVIAGSKDVDFSAQVQALATAVNQRKAIS